MKLTLNPTPTFELNISIPVAGQLENADVTLTVKHYPQSKLNDLLGEDGIIYADFAREVLAGWDLDEELTPQNLDKVVDNYPHFARAVFEEYGKEYYKAAEKN